MTPYVLNLMGLTSGFVGTLLIFFFGVPRVVDTGGKIAIVMTGVDEEEKVRIRRAKAKGSCGLLLIVAAFGLQLWALLIGA